MKLWMFMFFCCFFFLSLFVYSYMYVSRNKSKSDKNLFDWGSNSVSCRKKETDVSLCYSCRAYGERKYETVSFIGWLLVTRLSDSLSPGKIHWVVCFFFFFLPPLRFLKNKPLVEMGLHYHCGKELYSANLCWYSCLPCKWMYCQ